MSVDDGGENLWYKPKTDGFIFSVPSLLDFSCDRVEEDVKVYKPEKVL